MATKLDSPPIVKESPDLSVAVSPPDASLVLADRQVLNGVCESFDVRQGRRNFIDGFDSARL